MDDMARAAEVARLGAPTVALACHLNPDADALGSMLGLAAFLRGAGTATVCSFPNEPLETAALGGAPARVRGPRRGRATSRTRRP